MAATIMKSLVNQWHHSSSYLAIASVCLSTARAQQRLQRCDADNYVNWCERGSLWDIWGKLKKGVLCRERDVTVMTWYQNISCTYLKLSRAGGFIKSQFTISAASLYLNLSSRWDNVQQRTLTWGKVGTGSVKRMERVMVPSILCITDK